MIKTVNRPLVRNNPAVGRCFLFTQQHGYGKIIKIHFLPGKHSCTKERAMVMNKNVPWKDIVLIVAIIYFISPVDLVPGVLTDDLAALVAALLPYLKRAMWL